MLFRHCCFAQVLNKTSLSITTCLNLVFSSSLLSTNFFVRSQCSSIYLYIFWMSVIISHCTFLGCYKSVEHYFFLFVRTISQLEMKISITISLLQISLHHLVLRIRTLPFQPHFFKSTGFAFSPHPIDRRIEQQFDVILGSALTAESGRAKSHSVDTRKWSSLAKVGFFYILDHAKACFFISKSISASSRMRLLNIFITLWLQPLPLRSVLRSTQFLVKLKSPYTTHFPLQSFLREANLEQKTSSLPKRAVHIHQSQRNAACQHYICRSRRVIKREPPRDHLIA